MDIKYRIDLYKLLPKNPVTCELGVAEGNFSYDICREWMPTKHYMVDNWSKLNVHGDGSNDNNWHDRNYEQALYKIRDYHQIEILKGITWEMARLVQDASLDLLYIDACHSYECVKNDLAAWYPKVKPGGVIAFHDYLSTEYGVNQATNEFALQHGLEIHLIPENKVPDAGAWIRI
jgi:hypothetical protein